MKILKSLLLVAVAQAADLCTNGSPLIAASCDHNGFTIDVNEECRATHYSFVNWRSTFIDGVAGTVEWNGAVAPCIADGSGTAWTYGIPYHSCNMGDAVTDTTFDSNDMKWHVYTIYLNFDSAIDTALGSGNLQQLGQTEIICRIPANLQENAVPGEVRIEDPNHIEDKVYDVSVWDSLQLDVFKGGLETDASYGTALGSGSSINLGEHVKLQVNGDTTVNYNVAIRDCWASTVESIRTGGLGDDGTVGGEDFDPTGNSGAHDIFMFYKDMCPTVAWARDDIGDGSTADNSLEIELRQFAFNDGGSDSDGGAQDTFEVFYYHCEVDICLPGVDCVVDPTCDAADSNAPTGRRRRGVITSKRVTRQANDEDEGLNSSQLSVDGSNCPEQYTNEGIVTCANPRSGTSAHTASFGFLTFVLVLALLAFSIVGYNLKNKEFCFVLNFRQTKGVQMLGNSKHAL